MTSTHTSSSQANLAARSLGASVTAANDESFGEKENLVLDAAADFRPGSYGHKGEIVDGWETRRRREPGGDWALVRLGSPGIISAVDVDTSFFTGNFPPTCSVEACGVEGYPSPQDLERLEVAWEEVVPLAELRGDSHNVFPVDNPTRFTHVRLNIHPDGGVARLRVLGRVSPDPRDFDGLTVDLASRALGGLVEQSSDDFYSSAGVLNLPSPALNMGGGWETQRRRGPGNDWAIMRLAAPALIRMVELDTSYYKYNASKEFALQACQSSATPASDSSAWVELVPRTSLQPDTRHRFPISDAPEATYVRLDVFPDGGISRLRLFGGVPDDGRRRLGIDWLNTLPKQQALAVCTTRYGLPPQVAERAIALRPWPVDATVASLLAVLPEAEAFRPLLGEASAGTS